MGVSVVIPALNEAPVIASAIEKAWAAGAAEVIVADGGSHDGTPQLAQHAGAQICESASGRALQQNAGAALAKGEVLLFLHADTWLEAGAIGQVEEAIAHGALAGAFEQQIDAQGRAYRWLERGNAWRVRRLRLPYGDQGIFLRRGVFFELGGFPEVRLLEDVLLMRKFRRRARPVLLPGPLHVSARRWQQRGVVRQTLSNWLILAAHQCGVSPNRLARLYQRHDENM